MKTIDDKNFQLVADALDEALHLIRDEYESLCDNDLRKDYDLAIGKLEEAIKQMKSLS